MDDELIVLLVCLIPIALFIYYFCQQKIEEKVHSVRIQKEQLQILVDSYQNTADRNRELARNYRNEVITLNAKVPRLEANLEKANLIIRQANLRINELKNLLAKAESNAAQKAQQQQQAKAQSGGYSSVYENDYVLLGVSVGVTKEALKKHYRLLSSVYHPDKGTSNTAMMQRVNQAYRRLLKVAK